MSSLPLRHILSALILISTAYAADPPTIWKELQAERNNVVSASAASLREAWIRSSSVSALEQWVVIVSEIRSFPDPTPAHRDLFEREASRILALLDGPRGRHPALIAQQAKLVGDLLSMDTWTARLPVKERNATQVHLLALCVPTIRTAVQNMKSDWKPTRLIDPRGGAVFGATRAPISPEAIDAYEQALMDRSRQRAWNEWSARLRLSLPFVARSVRGETSLQAVADTLRDAGVGSDEADQWARQFPISTDTGSVLPQP